MKESKRSVFKLAVLAAWIGGVAGFAHAQPAEGLFTPQSSFEATNRLVSVSVFQWFTANGGQLTGPWRPIEGRPNWTGTTDFWRTQIKQMMAANFDVLYVHLIPSSEQQRTNLFRALNQLRREGWNVPKVAPFLDPMITWHQQPLVNVATPAGKDTFVSQYIRWFHQYYSVNPDAYADDFLARIGNRPILDTWHVKFNLTNLSSLTRADVETRLRNAFAASHPLFTNGIYMVTTALNDPTFAWTDEKVPQFEVNEYFRLATWLRVNAVQLKGGYWDQNIRNPGDFLARNGGVPYSNAWSRVNRAVHRRVYVESWNEYDEGTGIYAANPGPPYIRPGSGNTNTDVWSSSNDPYEYIKTTRRGASTFNDWPERDAKILWHDLPTRMRPGEMRAATVIVRNEGDALWSEAAKYRFGQKEFLDPVLFGPGRYLLNDAQDDIPTYGGIFRGRPKTFTLSLQAPTIPGRYTNHWSMMQESVIWFGQELKQVILVDPTPVYRGTQQAIDSTALLTNLITDHTEHTYSVANLPVGSYAECQIARTFAAPIKSLKLFIVSGQADDVGYVGGQLVTPNSANVSCVTGEVTREMDVTRSVTVSGNTATLTLRARDTCCCFTGWGEDTEPGRLNAKFRWEVELSPPVPTSPVFTNAANGRLYALLSPATWTWSEQAAVALGGHLVTIRNQAEQEWVFNTFGGFGGLNRYLWIGLNDVQREGTFVWSSGEPVNYTNWAPGEPNNALTGEDFVTLYRPGHTYAGRWNDWGERVFDGSRPFNGVVELVAPMGPPRITSQPQGGKVNAGDSFTFAVTATGSPTLRYQWRHAGTNLPGATGTSLHLMDIQSGHAGTYSVRVTNALGLAESSNVVLSVNHPPVAHPQTVELEEDSTLNLSLGGSDPDGDWLRFEVVSRPQHGEVTLFQVVPLPGAPPTNSFALAVYQPGPHYFGLDEFSFKVTDGTLESPPAIVKINVLPVNDPPVANPQSLVLDEDTPLSILLTGSDVEGDPLSFTIVAAPGHGSLSGTAPAVTYTPISNYFGLDSFTFKVSDGALESAPAAVNLEVRPVNDPPEVALRVFSLVEFGGRSNRVVLAPACCPARVILDASQTRDAESDPLEYLWLKNGESNALATGVVAVVSLPAGTNWIALLVNDGSVTVTQRFAVPVLAPDQAIEELIAWVECEAAKPRPLVATLSAAQASVRRCHPTPAINQLEAFRNQVRAQIAPNQPTLATRLSLAAQDLIDALAVGCGPTSPAGWPGCKIRTEHHGHGKLRVEFCAPRGRPYLIQASTNLVDWVTIGVASECGPETFEFEDADAGRLARRFYRIVAP